MDLAYQGEITTPSQCGRMDQCCAFGARPILMTFDGDKARASLWCKCTARFPSHKLILLQECHIRWHSSHSCDTEKLEEDPHETAHACGCARVQLDCEELSLRSPLYIVIVELAGTKDTVEILQKLNKAYPVAADVVEEKVQSFLGPQNKLLVQGATEAISAGDVQRLGELMTEYQVWGSGLG
mmetsp:Transcript_18533/g.39925  ORF Transcript_18533/g.39925 Transcript_18533/m.39925 type:complete len:183 (-) Transcript_18533:70-618(-)